MRNLRFPLSLWVPLYWVFLSSSRGILFWQPLVKEQIIQDYTSGSPLERLTLTVLIVLCAWILFRRRERLWPLLKANSTLAVLFLFMAFSILWSEFPYVSFKRFLRVGGTLLAALVMLTEEDRTASIRRLMQAYVSIAVPLSLLFIHVFPGLGTDVDLSGRTVWIGLTYTKNNLGQMAAVSALFLSWMVLERPYKVTYLVNIGFLALCLYLLVGSRSMTSIGLYAIGVTLLVLLQFAKKVIQQTFVFLLLVGSVVLITLVLMSDLYMHRPLLEYGIEQAGRDMTFTGRTLLWQDVFSYVLEKPLLGYGYGGFWIGNLGNDLWNRYTWRPNQAHNGYLDILVELGLIGLVLFAIFMMHAFRFVIASLDDKDSFSPLAFAILVAVGFTNLFESSFIRLNHLLWFVFLLAGIDSSVRISPTVAVEDRL